MALQIDIFFNDQFGSTAGFNYPSGICIINDSIYVVDKQNHLIKYFDLNGIYQGEFGSYGTGNDEFNFPEDITTDGLLLYITDSANHRVKVHEFDGTFDSEFGSVGSGVDEMSYPCGIAYYDGSIYIADRQNNRISVYESGVNTLNFGSYGSGDNEFNLPESVEINEGYIFVADSGNKKIKKYDLNFGSLLNETDFTFINPTHITYRNGALIAIDKSESKIHFFDDSLNYISSFGYEGSGSNNFKFPYSCTVNNGFLYVVDSGNNRVKIYNLNIETEVPKYSSVIRKLTRKLFPSGRAWWMKKDGVFCNFTEGLSYSESRAYQDCLGVLDAILPDNDNFTEEFATNWERALGLLNQTYLTLSERKNIILNKMIYPGGILARQHYLYIQNQLQDLGFDVYLHENRIPYDLNVLDFDGVDDYVSLSSVPNVTGTKTILFNAFLNKTSGYSTINKGNCFFSFSNNVASDYCCVYLYGSYIDVYVSSSSNKNSRYNIPENIKNNIAYFEIIKTAGTISSFKVNGISMVFDSFLPASVFNESKQIGSRTTNEYLNDAYLWDLEIVGSHKWLGTGLNANQDLAWKDQIGAINGTVNGSPGVLLLKSTYVPVNPIPAIYGDFLYGEAFYNGSAIYANVTKIVNYLDESKDDLNSAAGDYLKATFFIGGYDFGDRAEVPLNRKTEFREKILKLKPAQMFGYLLIDYV